MTAPRTEAGRAYARMADELPGWDSLAEWTEPIEHDAQVIVVAGTKGGKSTLAATMTLDVGSLVAIDAKARLTLPHARIVELPPFDPAADGGGHAFRVALRDALAWHDPKREGALANRVILRHAVTDVESFEAHDAMFRAVFERGATLLWIDEITATGATPQRAQVWLRAVSARGRTRGIGLWTLTQRSYGLTPLILRANAEYTIVGSVNPDDVRDAKLPAIELATTIPRKSGRFLLYRAGERDPYRLYLPIPPELRRWEAP